MPQSARCVGHPGAKAEVCLQLRLAKCGSHSSRLRDGALRQLDAKHERRGKGKETRTPSWKHSVGSPSRGTALVFPAHRPGCPVTMPTFSSSVIWSTRSRARLFAPFQALPPSAIGPGTTSVGRHVRGVMLSQPTCRCTTVLSKASTHKRGRWHLADRLEALARQVLDPDASPECGDPHRSRQTDLGTVRQ